MKSAAFNQMIAHVLTTPLATVTVYARLLKEAGLLTTGARGRNAPEMTPMDAARITIAILSTESPSQCVERVRRFGSGKYSPGFKRATRWFETMQPDQYLSTFKGETLEEVLTYIYSLPSVMGIQESCNWSHKNTFHIRIFDFEVRSELFQWKMDGSEIVGEIIVPFKSPVMVETSDGWRHVDGFTPIKGGVRVERSMTAMHFIQIGIGLLVDKEKVVEVET